MLESGERAGEAGSRNSRIARKLLYGRLGFMTPLKVRITSK